MTAGLLVVTAESADIKIINRLLLHLRSYDNGDEWIDWFRILWTLGDFPDENDEDDIWNNTTYIPLPEISHNAWRGASLQKAERIMLSANRRLFLLLDDQGVQDQTIILAERASNYDMKPQAEADREGFQWIDQYKKMRVSWSEAEIIWANLSIGNICFEEFSDAERGVFPADEFWPFQSPGVAEEWALQRRDASIRELKKLDLA